MEREWENKRTKDGNENDEAKPSKIQLNCELRDANLEFRIKSREFSSLVEASST